jgi:hypothetical protein
MRWLNPNCLLVVAFLVMLATPLSLQTAVEVKRGAWPRAFELFKQAPTAHNLRAYEKGLEDTSLAARTLRPWMQAVQFFGLRDAGAKALLGRNGWWFYQPSVNFLTQRPSAKDSSIRSALAAVLHFRDALAVRGIRLVLMPAPNKESVYPDMLSRFAAVPSRVPSPETRAFLQGCEAAGVEVLDLFTLYRMARQEAKAKPLYLAQDSHWTSHGLRLAAAAMSERLAPAPSSPFDQRRVPLQRFGDLVRMLQSPIIERRLTPEAIECSQVMLRGTQARYADTTDSDVLVLGDSFLRIYERDEPGSAGFLAHLAAALGRPVSSIINDGGASTLVRQELFRRPQLLARTKVVVWEFAERDLRLGMEGWQIVPLPPATARLPAISAID